MRKYICLSVAVLAVAFTLPARSQTESASATVADRDTVPITQILASVSKRTGKKFVVDPRVHADVTVMGQNISSISYADLLTILQVYGFLAAESEDYVRVVPDAAARQLATPTALSKGKHADAEMVTRIIPVKSMPAAQLVPILRPLLPQYAHLAAVVCRNAILMVDTYGNANRIESIIQSLDTGAPYQVQNCEPPVAPPDNTH